MSTDSPAMLPVQRPDVDLREMSPLALAFVEALGEDAALAPVRQVLTAQKVRIEKRRKEEQAHRKNVRRGKK